MAGISVEHIEIDSKGIARIAGTRSRVINTVMDMRNGLTPIQIHEQYPHLSLAQIHAALAFYYDHQPDIDADIESEIRELQRLEAQADFSPIRAELKRRIGHSQSEDIPG